MEDSKSSIPTRRLLSQFNPSDPGLVLRQDGEWLKISAAPDWWKGPLIQSSATLLCIAGSFAIFFPKGYLKTQSATTLLLIGTFLTLCSFIPLITRYFHFLRIRDYLVRYHLTERHLSGIHFPQTSIDDVDYFNLLSAQRGEHVVHEIQLVLKNLPESERSRLVYASDNFVQPGKIRAIFDEFTRLVGKPLF
jgi:hypothetical protein